MLVIHTFIPALVCFKQSPAAHPDIAADSGWHVLGVICGYAGSLGGSVLGDAISGFLVDVEVSVFCMAVGKLRGAAL